MKLIESEIGKKIYKEFVKVCVLKFGEIPSAVPKEILQEIEKELKRD